jgi:hypothetical protein
MPDIRINFGSTPVILAVSGDYKPGDPPPTGYSTRKEWFWVQRRSICTRPNTRAAAAGHSPRNWPPVVASAIPARPIPITRTKARSMADQHLTLKGAYFDAIEARRPRNTGCATGIGSPAWKSRPDTITGSSSRSATVAAMMSTAVWCDPGGATPRAYNRAEYPDGHRHLMQWWSDYLDSCAKPEEK